MKQILNNLAWIEELLPQEIESAPKHGGMAYYLDQKLVLILVEQSNSTYEHKGVTYPFQIWNGAIFPVEYKRQSAFFLKIPFLENHPANKDWLYIPADSDSFEEEVKQFVREIIKGNPLLGTRVKIKALSEESEDKKSKAPVKKKPTGAAKVSKKRENAFLLTVAKHRSK